MSTQSGSIRGLLEECRYSGLAVSRALVLVPLLVLCLSAENRSYFLGPDDRITVRVVDLTEFPGEPARVDERGILNLPLIGDVEAEGRTLDQLRGEIELRLHRYLRNPKVTVSISEFRSQPVSVFGSVTRPGVMQIRGPRTLWEVLSDAGGLKNDAGRTIRISRRLDHGGLPLPGARVDEGGNYSVAELDVRSIVEMTNPEENIEIMAHDVISVSQADVVYVVGHVNRAGGFVTNGSISVLEALALAGGTKPNAKEAKAHILRELPGTSERLLIPINLKDLLHAKAEDVALKPQDILFIPNDGWKDFGLKMATAAAGSAAGAAIYAGLRGY